MRVYSLLCRRLGHVVLSECVLSPEAPSKVEQKTLPLHQDTFFNQISPPALETDAIKKLGSLEMQNSH